MFIDMEEWKDVIGYEGLYQVSNSGKVKRLAYYNKVSGGGKSQSMIARCARGERNKYKNYVWRYEKVTEENNPYNTMEE